MTETNTTIELVSVPPSPSPAESAKQLARHKKNIKTFVRGARKGAAELYGYAYLAGREMLSAKAFLPHGNKNKDPEGGLQAWLEEEFPDIDYRTCARWMSFARDVDSKAPALPEFQRTPLQLTDGKMTAKGREAILEIIPQLMDGKSMTSFMRDSKLARDPEHQGHTPPKKLTPEEKVAAQIAALESHVNRALEYITLLVDLSEVDAAMIKPELWSTLVDSWMRLNPRARELSKTPKSKLKK